MKKPLGFVTSAVATVVLAGGYWPTAPISSRTAVLAAESLADLKGVDELKTLFNRDAGKTRLVLLLSPT